MPGKDSIYKQLQLLIVKVTQLADVQHDLANRITSLEALLLKKANQNFAVQSPAPSVPHPAYLGSLELTQKEKDLATGKVATYYGQTGKIPATKDRTGVCLVEARNAVEAWMNSQKAPAP